MSLKKWFRDKIAGLTIAVSSVEKNSLGQNGTSLTTLIGEERRSTEGQLADSLIHGEVTQEVKNLRWRTYKVLKETNRKDAKIVGYDDEGNPIVHINDVNQKNILNKIKTDTYDDYELELVVDNSEITNSISELLEYIENSIISSNYYFAFNKTKKPITLKRSFIPKFELEKYCKKLHVKKIDENKRLLEFYVSKYPDEFNVNFKLFLKEVEKVINNGPRNINFLEINEVSFITDKTIGSIDFLHFEYKILFFDKIVEFDGNYVIKFISEISINGVDLLEMYKEEELEEKYKNKEARKII
jgi:hypothetical protein